MVLICLELQGSRNFDVMCGFLHNFHKLGHETKVERRELSCRVIKREDPD